MKTIKHLLFSILVLLFTLPSVGSDLDISSYDMDVSSYILDVYQRLNKQEIEKEEFEKLYNKIVQAPSAQTMADVTAYIHSQALGKGRGLTDHGMVLFTHKIILGQNTLRRSYGKAMIDEDMEKLKKGKYTQVQYLKEYLGSDQGRDRMEELVSGDIQQARFEGFRLSQND